MENNELNTNENVKVAKKDYKPIIKKVSIITLIVSLIVVVASAIVMIYISTKEYTKGEYKFSMGVLMEVSIVLKDDGNADMTLSSFGSTPETTSVKYYVKNGTLFIDENDGLGYYEFGKIDAIKITPADTDNVTIKLVCKESKNMKNVSTGFLIAGVVIAVISLGSLISVDYMKKKQNIKEVSEDNNIN